MKLLFVIVSDEDARRITCNLIEHDMSVTKISSTGGFLRGGNCTLMVGVEKDKLDEALEIIKEKSKKREISTISGVRTPENSTMPVEISVGGATVFVVEVESFFKL